ncbi:MAG: flagellar hook-length control protein FliK [Pseudomonadota bacterium]
MTTILTAVQTVTGGDSPLMAPPPGAPAIVTLDSIPLAGAAGELPAAPALPVFARYLDLADSLPPPAPAGAGAIAGVASDAPAAGDAETDLASMLVNPLAMGLTMPPTAMPLPAPAGGAPSGPAPAGTGAVGAIAGNAAPTAAPAAFGTPAPTQAPVAAPTAAPLSATSAAPTSAPSQAPGAAPSAWSGVAPTAAPSGAPASSPTQAVNVPSAAPSAAPAANAASAAPSAAPTLAPRFAHLATRPVAARTGAATGAPSAPTGAPSAAPQGNAVDTNAFRAVAATAAPTGAPSAAPTPQAASLAAAAQFGERSARISTPDSETGTAPIPVGTAAPADAAQFTPTAAQNAMQQAADQLLQVQRRGTPLQRSDYNTISGAALAAGVAPAPAPTTIHPGNTDGATFQALNQPGADGIGGAVAPAQASGQRADPVQLAGTPEQWQQPLRAALGDRLQLQLQRNNNNAVIVLSPPNMGHIEISIRHSAGALQVNLSANNSEVLRQLNAIGDTVRNDLSQRQFSDVAVTVSATPRDSQSFADGGRGGQQQREQAPRDPGRALSEGEAPSSTFAMLSEQE